MRRAIVVGLVLTGCASSPWWRNTTEGHVPCTGDDILISNQRTNVSGPATWTATCRGTGQRYFCSGGENGDGPTSCTAAGGSE